MSQLQETISVTTGNNAVHTGQWVNANGFADHNIFVEVNGTPGASTTMTLQGHNLDGKDDALFVGTTYPTIAGFSQTLTVAATGNYVLDLPTISCKWYRVVITNGATGPGAGYNVRVTHNWKVST